MSEDVSMPGAVDRPLVINLFGPMEVRVHGAPLRPLRTRKGQWLLALLALRHGAEVSRAWLAGTLWPETMDSQALSSLRRCLTDLRQALGTEAEALRAPTQSALSLDLGRVKADLPEFDALAERGDRESLERAVSLYRGVLLEGCTEEWVWQERQAREQAFLAALETLASTAMEAGDPATAARHLRRATAADPFRESAHRVLMSALAASGDYAAATLVYRELRGRLYDELNAQPSAETAALFEQIRTEARQRVTAPARKPLPPSSPHAFAALEAAVGIEMEELEDNGLESNRLDGTSLPESTSHTRASHGPETHGYLPRPLTELVGRQGAVREIRERLSSARLVTLTGPGGMGKTRLAIRVAEESPSELPGGAWFVDLAAVSDPELVPQAVASALGQGEQRLRPMEQTLADYLRDRKLLLVLDNCEHLVDACARLCAPLLASCPDLRILATSREALGLTGEVIWRVPGLALPSEELETALRSGNGGGLGWPECLAEYAAVRLFIERGVTARGSFALTEANADAVLGVCRRLDGIALAIELAAARLKVLSAEQIFARLDDVFRLLTGGSRTALPRQQTLRATLDWSYQLLTPEERALLRRLAIFAGLWTLEAAESVCSLEMLTDEDRSPHGGSAEGEVSIERDDVLPLLTQLVEKSLVWVDEAGGDMRYRLFESTRAYGRELLEASGEAERVHRSHAAYFTTLAELERKRLEGPDQAPTIDRLDAALPDSRAALDWLMRPEATPEDGHLALRIATASWRFWVWRGHFSETGTRLTQLLNRITTPSRERAELLGGTVTLVLDGLASFPAREVAEQCCAAFLALGDERGAIWGKNLIGKLAHLEGKLDEAEAWFQEVLSRSREIGYHSGIAMGLNNMGLIARYRNDLITARAYHQECLEFNEGRRNVGGVAWSYVNLAAVLPAEEYASIWTYLRRSLDLFRQMRHVTGVAICLAGLGVELWRAKLGPAGDENAVRLLCGATALENSLGLTRSPHDLSPLREPIFAELRERLGAARFEAAWSAASALNLEQAAAYALALER